jgi:cell division protein FtsL
MKGPVGVTGSVMGTAFAAALFAAVGAFHAWAHTRVVTSGYELARLESEHRQLSAERERLRLEVATLRAPGRLEQFARTKLGMAPPALGSVVSVGAGGRVLGRLPGPAEPSISPAAVASRLRR